MFRFIADILVRSQLKKENDKRKKKFLAWQQIEKVALLLESEESLQKNEIDKFVYDSQKYVEVIYVELRSKEPSFGNWKCFIKKDKNLLGLPKKNCFNYFEGKKYDLLINTCKEENLFALSLTAKIQSTLHCSSVNVYNESDLIVKRLENQKLINYLNNTLIYLKMIKT